MMKKFMIATAICGGLFATSLQAKQIESPSRTISIAGLDTQSEAGRLIVERKIAAAARTVCGVAGSDNLTSLIESRNCYRNAVRNARSQLDRS